MVEFSLRSSSLNDSALTLSPPSSISSPPQTESPSSPFRLKSHINSTMRPHELWNPGVYSSYDTSTLPLVRTLTITSDSGRESASDDDMANSPPPRLTSRPLTIYQIEKAKAAGELQKRRMQSLPSRSSYTSASAMLFKNDAKIANSTVREQSLPPSKTVIQNTATVNGNVLRIYIPASPPNTLPRTPANLKQNQQPLAEVSVANVKPLMEPNTLSTSLRDVLEKRAANKSSGYRVSAWEAPITPGRIENFEPEVNRRSGSNDSSIDSTTSNRAASAASSSASSTRAIQPNRTKIEYYTLQIQPKKPIESSESGHTLSDISSCTTDLIEAAENVLKNASRPAKSTNDFKRDSTSTISSQQNVEKSSLSSQSKLFTNSSLTATSEEVASIGTVDSKNYVETRNPKTESDRSLSLSPLTSDSSVSSADSNTLARVTRMSDTAHRMFRNNPTLPAWRSKSVEQFNNRSSDLPKLVEEKNRKRVVFPDSLPPDNEKKHLYENIEDCRSRTYEHPQQIMPLPGRRLPFRQPPRVPVLSLPTQIDSRPHPIILQRDVGPAISTVSYRFYDSSGREQNSLSQRVSAQLLKRSAMRMSLPRNRSTARSEFDSQSYDRRYDVPHFSSPPPRQSATYESQHAFPGPLVNSNSWAKSKDQKKETRKSNQFNDPIVTVNGKQHCAHCRFQLGRGQAMKIDALNLYYHLQCFRCSNCNARLETGSANGTDVRVNGSELYCQRCYNFTVMSSRI
ncbi:LIM zinc-binding domain-containing protein [Aphelenchoides besseyi]|nr:LIM zinc-binding domain-containing protein [Aphelenchoides besseyi]